MWHYDLKMPNNALLTMQQPPCHTLSQNGWTSNTERPSLSHFLQFWCSSVNHEAKCVHLQPPWSFWWHLAHIWKFGLILDFMSLMTPALPTALGYYLVAAFQKDKSHPTAGFRMSRVFPHRLWDCKPAPVVSSSLSRNWLPLQAAAILSSL